MLVFWNQRLVLLSMPKTGSTALSVALEPLSAITVPRPPQLKHTHAQRYHRFVGPWLENSAGARFDVVALMREPVDWLGSWYRYRQREEIIGKPNSTGGVSFNEFVEAYMAPDRPPYANLGSQLSFVKMPDGSIGVDRLFCYEDIGRFVEFLEDRLDFAIHLPRVNVSPEGETALDPAVRARLAAHSAEEFALYERVKAGELS
ncbi:hypothetical protein [Phaeovulum vinaykumarii]|uniref:Gamma-glutamyl kinase n=1 Tax=Phaeovulum vinaykumarii TaxID=407234 RepID=A0A1N7MGK6_9RHOB|nr:hypothetical protein [Phaeovulum vinaykumarii]SIS85168.1 hypothetical protein SAMN05421795_10792 [Phaeovulum vinaykumarii]SOC12116.1 hypothetical protein SAMN05878426_10792 [Phaeovulum vinaykumarii]